VKFVADPVPAKLEVVADRTAISAAGKDTTRVMIRALDQAGNKLPFLFEVAEIAVNGAGRRLGPAQVPLRGGAAGFWLESTGEPGAVTVTVSSPRFASTTITVNAR
jgi:beta-galactosidase